MAISAGAGAVAALAGVYVITPIIEAIGYGTFITGGALIGGAINAVNQYDETGAVDAGEVFNSAFHGAVIAGGIGIASVGLSIISSSVASAITGGIAAAEVACADGDCGNEIRNTSYPVIKPPSNRAGLCDSMGIPPSDYTNPQAHHNLPWAFREWFAGEGRGINVNNIIYGRWVEGTPPGNHQLWSSIYLKEWAIFKANNPNATRTQVLKFLDQLLTSGRFPSK